MLNQPAELLLERVTSSLRDPVGTDKPRRACAVHHTTLAAGTRRDIRSGPPNANGKATATQSPARGLRLVVAARLRALLWPPRRDSANGLPCSWAPRAPALGLGQVADGNAGIDPVNIRGFDRSRESARRDVEMPCHIVDVEQRRAPEPPEVCVAASAPAPPPSNTRPLAPITAFVQGILHVDPSTSLTGFQS